MGFFVDFTYVQTDGINLFTVIMLPEKTGKFPVVVVRNPYVDEFEQKTEEEICQTYLSWHETFLLRGYAVVYQHCRGRGKSDGDCIPYINEGKDTNALYDWIRQQPFYNGELFLKGNSYLSSVHFCASPYADDIKGAFLRVQDSERYNICYRNGFLKKGLHGDWYVGMYKRKTLPQKNYSDQSWEMLPMSAFTQTVLGEPSEDFDEMLRSPDPSAPFWKTQKGGADARGAMDGVPFPVLLETGFYDIYTGGVFDMWNAMRETTRQNCALLVSPHDHGGSETGPNGISFPNGKTWEKFPDYELDWLDYIRKGKKSPFPKGEITYYRVFENTWQTGGFFDKVEPMKIQLGSERVTYTYDPTNPPRFKGGISRCFDGGQYQDPPNEREDIVTVYTQPFEKEVFVKGKMGATLCVRSDCEDTCFYVRVSIEKAEGDFALRDDITSLCYALKDYVPNTDVELSFAFDEHAFRIEKGERLRVDIASANAEYYVRHTNYKGLYSEQTKTKKARNSVDLKKSELVLPIEI